MTIAIISGFAAVIIGFLLFASVIIRFRYEDTDRSASLSYTFVKFMFDITHEKVRFFLFRIPIYAFDAKDHRAFEFVKKKLDMKLMWKKKFGLSDLKLEYLIMAKTLMGGIRIRQLQINISGGYREPFYTGKIFAYYCAAKGIYPNLMSHVDFSPDFSSEKLNFEGKGLASLRMFYILRFVFGLLADKAKEKLNNLFVIRKKGASYG